MEQVTELMNDVNKAVLAERIKQNKNGVFNVMTWENG